MSDSPHSIQVEFDYLPVVYFAMQQNNVPVVRSLTIKNETKELWQNIQITLVSEPVISHSDPVVIEQIDPGETLRIDKLAVHLEPRFLAQLTERVSGYFKLEVRWNEQEKQTFTYPVDILAFDEWGGVDVLPEMLVSFITPNHPAIPVILKRASEILEKQTGSPSLDEYQSRDPERVMNQMMAIYQALCEQHIVYITPPASFENNGQRIRLTDHVLQHKMGTCLDMSLLYASCLEAAGIHPLIILIRGHAFAGAWLIEEVFPDSVNDDIAAVTKRVADGINEILLVETTCMNKGNAAFFKQAVKIAAEHIKQIDDFRYVLDVKRARFAGIKPLPQRIRKGEEFELEYDTTATKTRKQYTSSYELKPIDLSGIGQEVQITKQMLWERKLLDLSLRNNLLSLRITQNTLQLISIELDTIEDALADGKEFRILPMYTDWDHSLYDKELRHMMKIDGQMEELLRIELEQHRLRAFLPEANLKKALQNLYRTSRVSLEENGANTLYLALGFLRWYETPVSVRPRYAPILLLPVEIIRKSVSGTYVIRSREEDTLLNITLLEMLRQNFGLTIAGLDPLPTDESGVNVKLIYTIIRNAIKDQVRWEVDEQAVLGIFSFNKFIMWNDIHNNSGKLVQNDIVYSLMNGVMDFNTGEMTADAMKLDRTLGPSDLMLPISADSSQLEAIYEAIEGKSFILHGPPGTGKSQTITNIIANALYRGKRVLFVAEKMAALSVVQSRLAKLGLAPFCMELHSNKARKSTVMEKFRDTIGLVRYKSPEEFAREAEHLKSLRSELNTYIDRLHQEHPFGTTLYKAITAYMGYGETPVVNFPKELLDGLTKDRYHQWEVAIEALGSVVDVFGHPYKHPLEGIHLSSYSSSIREEASACFVRLIEVLEIIRTKQDYFNLLFGDQLSVSLKQIDVTPELIDLLFRIPELTADLLKAPSLNELLDEYRLVVREGTDRDRLHTHLLQYCMMEVTTQPVASWLAEWNTCEGKWFLPRYFGQKKIQGKLKGYAVTKLNKEEVPIILQTIITYQEKEKKTAGYKWELTKLFGKAGRNPENWEAIEQIIEDMAALQGLLFSCSKDIQQVYEIKNALAGMLFQGISAYKQMYEQDLNELKGLVVEFRELNEKLHNLLGVDLAGLYGQPGDWKQEAICRLQLWLQHISSLKDWYQWLLAEGRLKELGLFFLTDAYKTQNIPTDELMTVFRKSYNKGCIEYIMDQSPELELFNGALFESVIRKYKELSVEFERLTRRELYARLASSIPSFTKEAAQSSEVGILQRNIRNNARGNTIRRLFDQIPVLLQKLCPCMLMSPMSVAQFIDPDGEPFDLVIFDEASQVPTYEAVGAIARGKQIVIVGDPKQMPPTSFFATNTVDEENMDLEDLESILDDCLALSLPSRHLLWHYRSKHESLIAFSNTEYYESKLLTFPSPDNLTSKVNLVPVQGFYDKGKSRLNRQEAKEVVNEIVRRLSDEELRKFSIGVVTFSIVQQNLIEDLLSEALLSHPELEQYAYECEEPIFIKNLENVQGDERDVILFSVGYGPDKEGRVSMNFGPLNRVGGERRLNVAVSRARYEMLLFSTLRSDMIDLNKTSSVGVAGLKRFLEYAESANGNYMERHIHEGGELTLGDLIALELRKEGYKVHTHIGCSGYKIDLGIVDEDSPSYYRLGILCDGENYKNTKTARDREIVQSSVLSMLGWTIHRVWTLDWYENKEAVLQGIIEAIKNAPAAAVVKVEPVTPPLADVAEEEMIEVPEEESISEPAPVYVPVELGLAGNSPDEFYSPPSRSLIISQIEKVLEQEAPVSRTLLAKRVTQAWGIQRLTQKNDRQIEEYMKSISFYPVTHEDMVFIWKDEAQYRNYTAYRISNRDAADLPPEEVANGILAILQQQISLPLPDLLRVAAQFFGYARCGTQVDAAMRRGIREAEKRNYIKINDGQVVLA